MVREKDKLAHKPMRRIVPRPRSRPATVYITSVPTNSVELLPVETLLKATIKFTFDGVSRSRTYLLSIDEVRLSLVVCFSLAFFGAMSRVKRKSENVGQELLSEKKNVQKPAVRCFAGNCEQRWRGKEYCAIAVL